MVAPSGFLITPQFLGESPIEIDTITKTLRQLQITISIFSEMNHLSVDQSIMFQESEYRRRRTYNYLNLEYYTVLSHRE